MNLIRQRLIEASPSFIHSCFIPFLSGGRNVTPGVTNSYDPQGIRQRLIEASPSFIHSCFIPFLSGGRNVTPGDAAVRPKRNVSFIERGGSPSR